MVWCNSGNKVKEREENMELELKKLCVPVSADCPSGTDESYNPLYLQLEELAVGKPASIMGDSTVEGINPDWHGLQKKSLELWKTTRDLRVAMYLCLAGFALNGLKGFSDALSLAEYLVSERWEDFYPRLDPDDDNDPTERLNVFAMISPLPGCYSDPLMFINKFRTLRLIADKTYTLRDLLIIDGELETADEGIDPLVFRAEMSAVPLSVMQEAGALTEQVMAQLDHIVAVVNGHLDDVSISFATLTAELKTLRNFYRSFSAAPENIAENDSPAPDATSGKNVVRNVSGTLNLAAFVPANRTEALLLLQKGAEYFQKAEPTSPVPLLVNRAIRMSNMSFLDLLGDIEPGALEKGREIFGMKQEQE